MSTTIIRLVKDREHPYLMIARSTVRDYRLSLSERGFLIELLSMPDDWSISIRGLASVMKLGKNTVQRHLSSLIETGYCIRGKRERSSNGRLGRSNYTVFESPELASNYCPQSEDVVTHSDSPYPQTRDMEKRDTTNKLSYKNNNLSSSIHSASREAKTPHSLIAAQFRKRFREHLGYQPAWTGKEGKLLKQDLTRFGSDQLEWMIDCFFSDPPQDVKQFAVKAGWGYNVLHSQLDKLLANKKAQTEYSVLKRVCIHCGESQMHTGLECMSCHKPLTETRRVS